MDKGATFETRGRAKRAENAGETGSGNPSRKRGKPRTASANDEGSAAAKKAKPVNMVGKKAKPAAKGTQAAKKRGKGEAAEASNNDDSSEAARPTAKKAKTTKKTKKGN